MFSKDSQNLIRFFHLVAFFSLLIPPFKPNWCLRLFAVKDLIHWRDPKKSGIAFGVSLLLLLSLAAFSVISVVSYLLLALLCVTITFRIYKSVVQAVQKSSDGHPFK